MMLTLPVEEMARLQVAFKVSLPDGALTFEKRSTLPSALFDQPSHLGGLTLHFESSNDGSGVSLKVWLGSEPGYNLPEVLRSEQEQTATCVVQPTARKNKEPPVPTNTPQLGSSNYDPSSPRSSLEESPNIDNLCVDSGFGTPLYPWRINDELDILMADALHDIDPFGVKWPDFTNGPSANTTNSAMSSPKPLPYLLPGPQSVASLSRPIETRPISVPSQNQPYLFPSPYDRLSFASSPPTPSSSRASLASPFDGTMAPLNTPIESDISGSVYSTDMSSESSPLSLDVEHDSSRPYPCLAPDCSRWFKRDYTRKVHMVTHRRSKERKPFGCGIEGCAERFSRKHDRLRHQVGRHGLGSEWKCEPCRSFFSSKATLSRHLTNKHGESPHADR